MLISSPLYMEEIKELKGQPEITQLVSSSEQIHGRTVDLGEFAPTGNGQDAPGPSSLPCPQSISVLRPLQQLFPGVLSTCCPGFPSTQLSGPASSHPPSEGPSCGSASPPSGLAGFLRDSGLTRAGTITVWFSSAGTGLGRSPEPVAHLLCDLGEVIPSPLCVLTSSSKTGMKEVLILVNCSQHRVSAVEGCIRHT